MTIEAFLKKWKADFAVGKRDYKKLNHSLIEGEDLYLLTYGIVVTANGSSRTINRQRFFQTTAQSPGSEGNPEGDIFLCERILTQLESDAFKKYEEFIAEEVEKATP